MKRYIIFLSTGPGVQLSCESMDESPDGKMLNFRSGDELIAVFKTEGVLGWAEVKNEAGAGVPVPTVAQPATPQ